jgi:hypothetical protein
MKGSILPTKTMMAFAIMLMLNYGCNKKDKDESQEEDSTEQIQQSKDEAFLSVESDANLDEINTALAGNVFGKTSAIAGATVNDSTYISEKKIVITYNGANANGTKNRVGEVTVQLVTGSHWVDAGAMVKITYSDLKITHISSQKTIKINGFHLITNVNGGHAFVDTVVTHKIRGLMTVSFDNETSRSWSIARKRVITHYDLVYNVEVNGDTTIAGINNVVVWGTNRLGNMFYTQIQQPVQWSSACPQGPYSGVKVHKGLAREITVTFGVDALGNPATGTCPFGFRVNWSNLRGEAKSAVIGY